MVGVGGQGDDVSDPVGKRPRPVYDRVECRAELARFVRIMEGKLVATDYKAHWNHTDQISGDHALPMSYLFGRIQEEVRELATAMEGGKPHHIVQEAADVANFCMMLADRVLGDYVEET